MSKGCNGEFIPDQAREVRLEDCSQLSKLSEKYLILVTFLPLHTGRGQFVGKSLTHTKVHLLKVQKALVYNLH